MKTQEFSYISSRDEQRHSKSSEHLFFLLIHGKPKKLEFLTLHLGGNYHPLENCIGKVLSGLFYFRSFEKEANNLET